MGYNDKVTYSTRHVRPSRTGRRQQQHTAVRAKKNLGQHFLTDTATAQRIAATVSVCPSLPIVEVGGGMGMLTQYLLATGRPVHVVEIDHEAAAYLSAHFPTAALIRGDFLRMDLAQLTGGAPFVLTGNYPYDISSQILFKMLDYRDLIPCCTGLFQREVALRIASPAGTKAYGVLSVLLQAWYDSEYLFTVDEDVFTPMPRVKSAVVRLTRNTRTALGCSEALFRRIVKGTFNQRRKMLRVSLRSVFTGDEVLPEMFLSSEEMTRRPEQLTVDDFIALTASIAAVLKDSNLPYSSGEQTT